LEVHGRSLLAYSLDRLAGNGVTDTTIVTGHYDHLIHQGIGDRHLGMPVRYIYNGAFATTGSVVSLLAGARRAAPGPLLVLESDILYHPGFLETAMTMPDDVLLVADRSGSGDEVYVCADPQGRLEYLGKAAPPHLRASSLGEFAGITRLSPALAARYCAAAEALLERGEGDGHYEELIFELARQGEFVCARHCPGLPWTEIDTLADYARARDQVFPDLLAELPGIFGPAPAPPEGDRPEGDRPEDARKVG
jgi:choline kinase